MTKITEFVLIQFCLTYMARPYCRKRGDLCSAACQALDRAIGYTDRWLELCAVLILMAGRNYQKRQELFQIGMDILHDILCEEYPGCDDGIRYTEEMRSI